MTKSLALALVSLAIAGSAGAAQASTITLFPGASLSASIGGAPVAGSTVYSFNDLTFDNGVANLGGGATLTLHGGAQVVSGDLTNYHAEPYGDTNSYISVYQGTAATFTLTQPATTVGLEWGSVDTSPYRNIVEFYDGSTFLGQISGDDIASAVPGLAASSWDADGTVYANISSPSPITSFTMVDVAGGNSFEFDKVSVSAVPLPGTLSMFGSALIALGMFGRRRNNLVA